MSNTDQIRLQRGTVFLLHGRIINYLFNWEVFKQMENNVQDCK